MVTPRVLQFPVPAPAPAIDAAEARWVAGELAALLRHIDPESAAARVLVRARMEMDSLVRCSPGTVVGPVRVRVAA